MSPQSNIATVTASTVASNAAAPTESASTANVLLASVALPPASAVIPIPPTDFTPAAPGEFRAIVPRKAELTALSQALADLSRFSTFDQTMGALAPTLADVTAALKAGAQWTAMVQATSLWASYANLMQGLAWRSIRVQMDSLRPAFVLAKKRNPKLAEQFSGLSRLLAVPAAVAKVAVATKAANAKAEAAGQAPNHGKVGKARQRRAEKAALAAASQPAATTASNGTPAARARRRRFRRSSRRRWSLRRQR